MSFQKWHSCLLLTATAVAFVMSANAHASSISDCLTKKLESASDEMTVGALRKACMDADQDRGTEKGAGILSGRLADEELSREQKYVITPHRPNYLLVGYNFSDPNAEPFKQQFPNVTDDVLKDTEVKFQISLKFPLAYDLFDSTSDLYFAYTNRSFWQLFQDENDISSPFRETNHEPEVWMTFDNDWEIFGFTNRQNSVGLSHQSNGRAGVLSRSWNRLYANFIFEQEDLALGMKLWHIIDENDYDYNSDIGDYMGNFELMGVYKYRDHTFSALGRHNLDFDESRGAFQVDWSFPLYEHLRGYVQFFNGYGESLIDYNANVSALGVGIALTDW